MDQDLFLDAGVRCCRTNVMPGRGQGSILQETCCAVLKTLVARATGAAEDVDSKKPVLLKKMRRKKENDHG
jgi:hypothetical protein